MRIVCIDDSEQYVDEEAPRVKKGNVYTVLNKHFFQREQHGRFTYKEGNYYELIETGRGWAYHESCFMEINEDQPDETEFERKQSLTPPSSASEWEESGNSSLKLLGKWNRAAVNQCG